MCFAPKEARPGALGPWGWGQASALRPRQPRWPVRWRAGPWSRTGDGFGLFNFNFSLCGIPELFEIDHPLIG